MLRRRRPLLRAAAVGGIAYAGGKAGANAAGEEADPNAQAEQPEAEQQAAAAETRRESYGERPAWAPARPRIHPVGLLSAWVLSAAALLIAAWIVPGASVRNFGGALVAALVIAILNALLPPLVAALRLPLML